MISKTLHIHIERLIVDGLAGGQQRQFVRALESQLETQLPDLAADAFASGSASRRIPRVNAGQVRASATPASMASRITAALRQTIAGKGNPRA